MIMLEKQKAKRKLKRKCPTAGALSALALSAYFRI